MPFCPICEPYLETVYAYVFAIFLQLLHNMFSFGWLTQCLGAQLESPSAIPPPTQDNDTLNSNDPEAETARPHLLFYLIAQCLGARRKKSSCMPAK
ncbi:hypothetical protein TEQG_08802 [Trichophyton equinum CBS 127.97]|uniref:Uncharacterized protein n=1 Tax=Trichophyton equinum (strain ATCC MYA-4606 / CBS 127.97) TaxID=559882 RepID=F2Q2M7_TRIEC|nr:hypothetical protein TEQG_08802 [Trichophyton equinum CBS 127.97]